MKLKKIILGTLLLCMSQASLANSDFPTCQPSDMHDVMPGMTFDQAMEITQCVGVIADRGEAVVTMVWGNKGYYDHVIIFVKKNGQFIVQTIT